MTCLFTSDLHFNHSNILRYCSRPFKDVDHMNEILIANFNEAVGPDDTCYIIGDFAMGPKVLHKGFLNRLNGYKILIRGNHDGNESRVLAMGFNEVYINKLMEIDGKRVYMSHIPPRALDPYGDRFYKTEFTPEPPEYDVWLTGHVHEKWKRHGNIINVGVDVRKYRPVTFEQLLAASND